MSHLPFSERDIERLLEGNVPPGRGDLVELARLFARVRSGVEGEPAPPMSARLLAELDGAELSGRFHSELERVAERRRVQRSRRRWRAVAAAAAAVAVLGGAAVAGLRGPLGDDLRTRPSDEAVSVAEPDGSASTLADGESGDGLETAGPEEGSPNFGPSEEGSGDLGVSSGSSGGVATTEVTTTEPPTTAVDQGAAPEIDWDQIGEDCDGDAECVIDAAEEHCAEAGTECWADAADACGRYDSGCRYMLVNKCGADDECEDAVIGDGSSRDRRP
jgi:hypothetical protein